MNAAIVSKRISSSAQAVEPNLAAHFDMPIYSMQTDQTPTEDIDVRDVDFRKPPIFGRLFQSFVERLGYSFWKPPATFETIITSGLRTQSLTQWPEQRRIHYYHGIHRGAFGYPPRDTFSDNGVKRTLQMVNRLFIRTLNENSMNVIDDLIANSPYTAEMIAHHYGREPDAIIPPTFINTDEYYTNRSSKEDYYLYVGRLTEAKGIQTIVDAFAEIDKRLVVAGDGPLKSELEQRATENVSFKGYVSERRKKELFGECKGFVQNTFAEPFGITTIEALASGTPVIAANVGNNRYLIDDGVSGVLFTRSNGRKSYQRPESAGPLVDAIKRAEKTEWDPNVIAKQADPYDRSVVLDSWAEVLSE